MSATRERPTTAQLLRYFLYLGSLGFGGPVALVGYMQRDLVERRGWFTKDEYTKSLTLSQLAPGPLAAQLAICLGYVHSKVRGATLVALAFVLPSYVMTVAISWLYVRFGGLSWMQAAFYGVGATVIGIITLAAYKLARLTMAKDRLQWTIFAVMAIATAWTETEILWLFVLCGVVAMVVQTPPAFLRRTSPAWFDRFSENPKVKSFVGGVTAAASGAIAGACYVLARRAITDIPTLLIAVVALGIVWRFKVPEPVLIAAGAAAGLLIVSIRG